MHYYLFIIVVYYFSSSDQRKQLSDDGGDDFFEYTRGKKIPPEGIPGFDFSDPDSIVEFTKSVRLSDFVTSACCLTVVHLFLWCCRKTKMQKKRDADGVERTIPCPHKASILIHNDILHLYRSTVVIIMCL